MEKLLLAYSLIGFAMGMIFGAMIFAMAKEWLPLAVVIVVGIGSIPVYMELREWKKSKR